MSEKQTTTESANIEELYHSLGQELWARFYVLCCDPERASDALQEAFIRLQQQDLKTVRDPRAWLYRVGQNWLRDVARKKSNSTQQLECLDRFPGERDLPENWLLKEEQRAIVREQLAKLKEDDRTILILKYSLDWSSKRIAETLESTASAIDMRLTRARKRLAEKLEEVGFQYE